MPGYKTHIAGGLVVYGAAAYCVHLLIHPSWFTLLEWGLCTVAGSLFPDIDTKSKGQKLFYTMIAIVMLILFARGCFDALALLALCALVPILVRHRGLFHRSWFIIIFALTVSYAGSLCLPAHAHAFLYDALFFIAGALSHIGLDMGIRRVFGK
jgi:hypothetical protein